MMLYLVRHGSAAEAKRDRDRILTSVGRSEVEELRRVLEERGVHVDRILHSGFRRAEQTAAILASLSDAEPRAHAGLSPGDDPDLLIAELDDLGGSTLIVSHLPFLPALCEELLEPPTPSLRFRTAGAVCLENVGESSGRGRWRLAWQVVGN